MGHHITLVPADGDCTSCHSLRAQLEKVEIERGALQVAYDDLRGKVLGQCGQCNMLERADCYRRQDTAYQRGAREMRERAVKECDVIAAEDMARRYRPSLPSYCRDRIRALPDTLPTGPLERRS
jgi:hypothetical protein